MGGIAKYDLVNSLWSSLANNGLDSEVKCICVLSGVLYVGGNFHQTVDGSVSNLNNIAKYSVDGGGTWTPLAENGLNGQVNTIINIDSLLYVGGLFTESVQDSTPLKYIAIYNPADSGLWQLIDNSLDTYVNCICLFKDILYVGGDFPHGIVYLGSTWHPLANGV
jgi:hypothetical protein